MLKIKLCISSENFFSSKTTSNSIFVFFAFLCTFYGVTYILNINSNNNDNDIIKKVIIKEKNKKNNKDKDKTEEEKPYVEPYVNNLPTFRNNYQLNIE